MGRVPDLKRITVEDFKPENQEMIKKIAFVVNSFHEQVRNLFNGNIDETNLAEEFKTLTFTTDNSGQPLNKIKFNTSVGRARGLFIGNINITSANNVYPTENPLFSFSQNGNIVTIENISGLLPSTKYSVTILVKA